MAFNKEGIWITRAKAGPGPPPKRIGISPLDIEKGLTKMLRDDLAYEANMARRYKALSVKLKEHLDEARRLSLEKSKEIILLKNGQTKSSYS